MADINLFMFFVGPGQVSTYKNLSLKVQTIARQLKNDNLVCARWLNLRVEFTDSITAIELATCIKGLNSSNKH